MNSDNINLLSILNQKYKIEDSLSFNVDKSGFIRASLNHKSGSELEIFLYGAHISTWNTADKEPVLFMSSKANFEYGSPIRGGIPIVFPQFGKDGDMSLPHGFARIKNWFVKDSSVTNSGALILTLKLTNDSETEKYWPNNFFEFELVITLTETLRLELIVSNTGNSAFTFANALHTYFFVSDISNVSVLGLENLAFIDSTKKLPPNTEKRGCITITENVDRIYLNAPNKLQIIDAGFNRKIEISKSNFYDAVLWNPWAEVSKNIVDLGDEDYKKMLCLEVGNVSHSGMISKENENADEIVIEKSGRVLLNSGEKFNSWQEILVNKIES